jgi:hypothetical protein
LLFFVELSVSSRLIAYVRKRWLVILIFMLLRNVFVLFQRASMVLFILRHGFCALVVFLVLLNVGKNPVVKVGCGNSGRYIRIRGQRDNCHPTQVAKLHMKLKERQHQRKGLAWIACLEQYPRDTRANPLWICLKRTTDTTSLCFSVQ